MNYICFKKHYLLKSLNIIFKIFNVPAFLTLLLIFFHTNSILFAQQSINHIKPLSTVSVDISAGEWQDRSSFYAEEDLPPFHLRWWAYSIYVSLILILLCIHYRLKRKRFFLNRQLQQEHLELQKQRENNYLKSVFFTNISHEFRTPLTLIMAPVEKWLTKTDNSELKLDLEAVYKNSQHILNMVNELLDLSKFDFNKMKLSVKEEDIVKILKDLVLSFTSLAEQKEINLSFLSSNESIIVYVDQNRIKHIFSNLISNSFKSTPHNGKISVTISTPHIDDEYPETPQFIEITVKDTGKGISQDHLDHIFDRYYQVESVDGISNNSSGIGLSLVKGLTELHHGNISVRSKVGFGTTFVIHLPIGKDHLPAEILSEKPIQDDILAIKNTTLYETKVLSDLINKKTEEKQAEPVHTKDTAHILIIEDNADVRSLLRRTLIPEYRISEAENGIDGLEFAQNIEPNLIICDVMMPGMDGCQLCRKIKEDPLTSHIPVIILTARVTTENKINGLLSGADDYLFKPYNTTELLVRIKNLILQRINLQLRFHEEIIVQPSYITVTPVDKLFLQHAIAIVEKHIDDFDLETQFLADEIGMSRMNVHRKLKALTAQTPSQFICSIRLKRAAQLLKQHSGNVTEVAYDVGFNSSSYFAKCFRTEFGTSPSEFAKCQEPS